MTVSSYETRRYAGTWKIPWGTVRTFEFERTPQREATATQCVVDVDMLGFWRRVVDRQRGPIRDVDLVSDKHTIHLTLFGPGRTKIASVMGTWNLDAIHGLCLSLGRPAPASGIHWAAGDDPETAFRGLFERAEHEYPNVRVRGDRIFWFPALCVGKLRELWLEVGKPQCGELVLQRCERRSNEVFRFHFSSTLASISRSADTGRQSGDRQVHAESHLRERELRRSSTANTSSRLERTKPARSGSADRPSAASSNTDSKNDAQTFEQLVAATLSGDTAHSGARPSPKDRIAETSLSEGPHDAGGESVEDVSAADILAVRLQKLRAAIRGGSVTSWASDEIGELMLQYPERPEVYLLGFDIFVLTHDVTRAWNTLDSLEKLGSLADSLDYELAKARKRLANLVDRVGRGPSDSVVAWMKYALLRPLDGDAFQRILRFSQEVGIHADFESLVRRRINAILDRDDIAREASSESPFDASLRYPAEAIYPALMLIAQTTSSSLADRQTQFDIFSLANDFPAEWWDDALSFSDDLGSIPSVEEEAEIWAEVLREASVELVADQSIDETQPEQASASSGSGDTISYIDRVARIRAVSDDKIDDDLAQRDTAIPENLDENDTDESSAASATGQTDKSLSLPRLDRLASEGRIEEALGEISNMLRSTRNQAIRSELLLRKAQWLRETGAEARKVSFALTGVRILKPHSLEVHEEFIKLHLRESQTSKAREAAIALLDSLVTAYEPLDYESHSIVSILRDAGIDSSRVLPSRLQSDLEKSHPLLLDLLGHE